MKANLSSQWGDAEDNGVILVRFPQTMALPQGYEDVVQASIHHLVTGEPLHLTLATDFNLDVMAFLDAGIRSAASEKLELVDNPTWRIG